MRQLASELEVGKEAILSQLERALRSRRRTQEKTAMRAVQQMDASRKAQPTRSAPVTCAQRRRKKR